MMLGILTLITALSISAVAIYYSVAGLVAIFAAAAVPIMIMGGVLEISKLVTAVWLHRYWRQATWWLKTYLSTAVIVLMLITSMGIFGFLSKAHIEQTAAAGEGVAQIERITVEVARQQGIIARAEEKIQQLQTSGTGADANIQSQIDKEQERIDKAYERIAPAIAQQNQIITDARNADGNRTKPYEDQLANIQAEILRLETSAKNYEDSITNLDVDSSAVEPLLAQIANLEEEIIRVTNQLNSSEQQQIRAGQAIIGVTNDGLFGSNTRTALAAWVAGQRERITQIQGEVAQVRKDAQETANTERDRLAGVVKDIRERQIPALKDRELTMLGKIDEVRQTESPAIQTARDEIQRLRESAESQVAQSQALIERLRSQLAKTDKAQEIDAQIDEQNVRIREANNQIDTLTEEKYALEAEYRKLEAEVGPVKYIAEFIYGDQAGTDLLEEAVRWVIIVIIFVFDPLAVLLLIASQYTFEFTRRKDDDGGWLRHYEQIRAQRIVDNPGYNTDDPAPMEEKEQVDDRVDIHQPTTESTGARDRRRDAADGMALAGKDLEEYAKSYTTTDDTVGDVVPETDTPVADVPTFGMEPTEVQADELTDSEQQRSKEYELKEKQEDFQISKTRWKEENPNDTLKRYKNLYIKGVIDHLPWEQPEQTDNYIKDGYQQNAEQNESTLFNKLQKK